MQNIACADDASHFPSFVIERSFQERVGRIIINPQSVPRQIVLLQISTANQCPANKPPGSRYAAPFEFGDPCIEFGQCDSDRLDRSAGGRALLDGTRGKQGKECENHGFNVAKASLPA